MDYSHQFIFNISLMFHLAVPIYLILRTFMYSKGLNSTMKYMSVSD